MYNESILNFKGYLIKNGINIRHEDSIGPYRVIACMKIDNVKYVAARGKNGIRFFKFDMNIDNDIFKSFDSEPVYDLEWENCKVMFETLKSDLNAGITDRQLDYDMDVISLYLMEDIVH